ncbi:glycosyltransferase family 2 protein [sulfur-oxidizing endosymbiont of Gigantopelta aegis]|uniref:glycosyltransferase family 2 protein n=1 Tax=sulfur-oxidizing endosymbiont of Gigantopelta aegis TaxID=2794934 RepID=UPI001FE4A31D|nr:glycosyltransferase family 2 protein [sulfur-oxidizing endosymbiont of Gigantopelta aegis]
MYKHNKISIVIPCYKEEKLLGQVIEGLPDFVDTIIVVDDNSPDNTYEVAQNYALKDSRILVIQHKKNEGVGGAISTGYKKSLQLDAHIAVVMAGDAQMDPEELPLLLDPIIEESYDYAKGDRLSSGQAWEMIPKIRYLGNSALSLLTKIASGYWHVKDSQSGYTAISKNALQAIDWDKTYKRYGQPNDLLVRLNIHNFRVKDVPIRPIYNIESILVLSR